MFRPTYFITIFASTIGGSTQFYNYNVVNPVQETMIAWLNETLHARQHISATAEQLRLYWSVVVSSIAIGAICGSLLTSVAADSLGRRNALVANGAVNTFGAFLQYLAHSVGSPEFLLVGRFVLGVNLALASGLVPMYLMEITPVRYRGTAATVHQIVVAFSDWFSLLVGLPEVLGGVRSWQLALSLPGAPAFLLCVILPFCPESPKYTLCGATKDENKRAIGDLRRLVDDTEADDMFDAILRERMMTKNHVSFCDLLTRRQLRFPLLVAVWMMVAQQFTGCAAVFAYSTDMFISAKLPPFAARYSTLVLGVVYFLATSLAALVIERLGRRVLSLLQLSVVTVALVMISGFTWIQRYSAANWTSYGAVSSMVIYMCAYGIGSPIPWMITAEIFPTKYRSKAMTLSLFTSWSLLFIISLGYLPFKELVGVSSSFLPFIVVSAISVVFVYLLLPGRVNLIL